MEPLLLTGLVEDCSTSNNRYRDLNNYKVVEAVCSSGNEED
jgi:hypothetical protein